MADPIIINPNNSGTVEFGDTAYECQVVSWLLEPTANTSERAGTFCSPPSNVAARSTWACSFEYLQDWGGDPDAVPPVESLSQWLFDNDGTLQTLRFTPTNPDVPIAEVQAWIVAGAYGGDAGEAWTHTGDLPVEGTPTITPQTPPSRTTVEAAS